MTLLRGGGSPGRRGGEPGYGQTFSRSFGRRQRVCVPGHQRARGGRGPGCRPTSHGRWSLADIARHMILQDLRNATSKCLSMTWPALFVVAIARRMEFNSINEGSDCVGRRGWQYQPGPQGRGRGARYGGQPPGVAGRTVRRGAIRITRRVNALGGACQIWSSTSSTVPSLPPSMPPSRPPIPSPLPDPPHPYNHPPPHRRWNQT